MAQVLEAETRNGHPADPPAATLPAPPASEPPPGPVGSDPLQRVSSESEPPARPEFRTAAARHAAAFVPPDGLFVEGLKLWEAVTDAPALWHVGALLSLAGHLLNRRVWMPWGAQRLHANLFVGLVAGPPNLRRSTVVALAQTLLEEAGGPPVLSPSYTRDQWVETLGYRLDPGLSPEEVRQAQAEIAAAADDRLGRGLDAERGAGWGPVDDLAHWLPFFDVSCNCGAAGLLAGWFDGPTSWAQQLRKAGTLFLYKPCISLLGTCDAGWLVRQGYAPRAAHDFWNRWRFLPVLERGPLLAVPGAPPADQQRVVVGELRKLREVRGEMALDGAARRRYQGWLTRLEQGPEGGRARPWRSRLGTAGLKVAMIYQAVLGGAGLIGDYAMDLATGLVDEVVRRLDQLSELGGTKAEADHQRVCRVLQEAGPAGMMYSPLLKRLSPMSTQLLKSILATLVDQERVAVFQKNPTSRAHYYRWVGAGPRPQGLGVGDEKGRQAGLE